MYRGEKDSFKEVRFNEKKDFSRRA